MPTIPNLSKLTLIETEPTGVRPFAELPPELDAMILEILMESYKGPREVCMGLRVMMKSPELWARTPIGTLLVALADAPLVQEQLWRLAFLKYFGLPDPMVDEDVFTNQNQLKWAELFDRMCGEMKLFDMAQSPQTSIKLDWKNNASWTPYQIDEMFDWVKRMVPTGDGTNNQWQNRTSSPTMQVVLQRRGASRLSRLRRIERNQEIYDMLVPDLHRVGEFLTIADQVPMKDVDMSIPVTMGTWHGDSMKPYHRIISTLTRQMLNGGIVRQEDIKGSDYPKVMQALVEKMRASPDVPTDANDSPPFVPLCMAIHYGDHVMVVDLLMELGASTEPDLPFQLTPLMLACLYGEPLLACATALVGWGANVNASRVSGDTPLSLACQHCNSVQLVKMLLESNADPAPHTRSEAASIYPTKEYRRSPLDMTGWASAAPSGNTLEIIALLQEYEAKTKADGFSADSDDVRRLERHRRREQRAVFFKKE